MAKRKTDKSPPATTATLATRWSFERAIAYAWGRLQKSAHMTDERQWLDPTFRGLNMLKSDPKKLIEDSRLNADAFDALRFAIACKIERNEPLADNAKAWAASYLRGEIEMPIRKSGAKTSSGKHRAIVDCIAEIAGYGGLNAMRNDAAKAKESACDAVAAALRDLEMEPETFEGVRDLWKQRRKIAPDRFAK